MWYYAKPDICFEFHIRINIATPWPSVPLDVVAQAAGSLPLYFLLANQISSFRLNPIFQMQWEGFCWITVENESCILLEGNICP